MKVFVTRKIPDIGIKMMQEKGIEVEMNDKDRSLSKEELKDILSKNNYDAVLTLLTDQIDSEIINSAPTVKLYANYAIGYNNFDIKTAIEKGIYMTNTPGGGADRVSEHTWALILALSCRIVEADKFVKSGKYNGWDPMLLHGISLHDKTLGIIGTGRIGAEVVEKASLGFRMKVVYYDVKRNEDIENKYKAVFCSSVDELLKISDVISIHVPLLESTHHLINSNNINLMKKNAILINTSRGPVVEESALYNALKNNQIAGAGLDVFEFEPKITEGLCDLNNVILTPHIASATDNARKEMSEISANNIIDLAEGRIPRNNIAIKA
jgi:glyoxylate reductase